jgi:molybdenum cofactor synthesis domain-containing protein
MKRSDLKRTFKLIEHEEALNRLISSLNIEPEIEEIAVGKSVGRVLAQDVVSTVDIPKSNHAIFDGYVIHSEDIKEASMSQPLFLKVVGTKFPGEYPAEFSNNESIFAATGAAIQNGGYALIKGENLRRSGNEIEVRFPVKEGENIAQKGEDVKRGMTIFTSGHVLRPQDVGMMEGLGMKFTKVFIRPKIAIISVGDELRTASIEDTEKTVNNYAIIISSLVEEFGGTPLFFGIVKDETEQIKRKISEALEEADIVVTISGCSVGPRDLVPDAIESLSGNGLIFHGIKLSPGKVIGAGIVKNKPVIMLPGHIASTLAGFYLFNLPIQSKLSGLENEAMLPIFKARLSTGVKKKYLCNFLRLRLNKNGSEFDAKPIFGGSSRLNNGFSIIPARKELKKGEEIDVTLYSPRELAHIFT